MLLYRRWFSEARSRFVILPGIGYQLPAAEQVFALTKVDTARGTDLRRSRGPRLLLYEAFP